VAECRVSSSSQLESDSSTRCDRDRCANGAVNLPRGESVRRPFHQVERTETNGYESYLRMFERYDRSNGGVPGLDWEIR